MIVMSPVCSSVDSGLRKDYSDVVIVSSYVMVMVVMVGEWFS